MIEFQYNEEIEIPFDNLSLTGDLRIPGCGACVQMVCASLEACDYLRA